MHQKLKGTLDRCSLEEIDLRGAVFSGEDAPDLTIGSIELADCTFSHCSMTDCCMEGTGLSRVVFEDCDLSGTVFNSGGLKDVTFRSCRMLGVGFIECTLNQVHMENCIGRYLNLASSTIKESSLSGGNYVGSAMTRLKLRKTMMTDCNFSRTDFTGTDMNGVDMSSCNLDGAIWSSELLRGMQVNTVQALELARLLGVEIVD